MLNVETQIIKFQTCQSRQPAELNFSFDGSELISVETTNCLGLHISLSWNT